MQKYPQKLVDQKNINQTLYKPDNPLLKMMKNKL